MPSAIQDRFSGLALRGHLLALEAELEAAIEKAQKRARLEVMGSREWDHYRGREIAYTNALAMVRKQTDGIE